MGPFPCFMMEETDRAVFSLRRYTEPGCYGPGTYGYHNAVVSIGDAPVRWDKRDDGLVFYALIHAEEFAGDPRWPAKCQFCDHHFEGFPFYAQVNQDCYYRRVDTGEEMLWQKAPFGAMRYVAWMKGTNWCAPDGTTLMVRVPKHHDWIIDGPAGNAGHNGPGWTRTGTPPLVTANPSILTPDWHGWLRNGVLVEC